MVGACFYPARQVGGGVGAGRFYEVSQPLLAGVSVPVAVEVVLVGPDHGHRPRVERAVAAAAFAVVVGGSRVEAGAFVARVARRGRFFFGFGFFRFAFALSFFFLLPLLFSFPFSRFFLCALSFGPLTGLAQLRLAPFASLGPFAGLAPVFTFFGDPLFARLLFGAGIRIGPAPGPSQQQAPGRRQSS